MSKKMLPKNVYVIHRNRKYPRILFVFPDNSRRSFKILSSVETAEQIAAEIRRKLDLGTFKIQDYIQDLNKQSITLEELANRYMAFREREYEKGMLSKKTIQTDRNSFVRIMEILPPDTLLDKITEADIDRFIEYYHKKSNYKSETYSTHSISTYLRHLRAAFRWAVQHGYMRENPIVNLRKKIIERSKEIRFYTPEQIALLDEWFDAQRSTWYKDAFHFCLSTGVRAESVITANIHNIRSEFIDGREIQFIKVTEKGPARLSRKTRWVPLLYEAPEIVERRRAILEDDSAIQRIASANQTNPKYIKQYIQRAKEGYIFFEVSRVDTVTHIISTAKRQLPQLGELSWHSTRHTFALRALEDGIPLEIVSEILGHSNIQDTRSMYLKYIPPRSMARSLSWVKSDLFQGD